MTNLNDVVELKSIPVFRVGSYPQGEFNERDVEALADGYDPAFHEAPNYLAHSSDGSSNLAFGWVRRLFVKGKTLFADFADVPRKFAELVLSGRIKKRSVEIYRDLNGKGPYLRAIAWPLIPEVKALADVHPTQVFNDSSEFQQIEFEEKETDMTEQTEVLTREDMEAGIRQLREELSAEQRKIIAELEVKSFCEQMVIAGKMTPAERQTEQPMLIEQRHRELTAEFGENEEGLSEQRMSYYRKRSNVVDIDAADDHSRAETPENQRLLRYFHDNQAFFSRMGVQFDDLAEAEKYQAGAANPLTD